jgi:prepilin-type N-terminal cleavage/methylation domain-containing protein
LNNKYFVKGFTLVELLVVVALLGILSAIAIPAYNGYIDSVKTNSAQNSLRLIYLTEVEQFSDNGEYYSITTSCGSNSHLANLININLFGGSKTIPQESKPDFYFCIESSDTATEYKAFAYKVSGDDWFSIDQNNNHAGERDGNSIDNW